MNQRMNNMVEWMKKEDIHASVITSTENVFYFTKFHCEPHERVLALVIFQNEEPIMIVPKMEEHGPSSCGWTFTTIGYEDTENPWELIKETFQKNVPKDGKIGIEKSRLSLEKWESILTLAPHSTPINVEVKINQLRIQKDEFERSILREAAKFADLAVEIGIHGIAKGKSELELVAYIETEMKMRGIRKMSFDTMVLTGKNSALPHGVPGLSKIEEGDFVLFDLGVIYEGYCSDISRTVAYKSYSDEQKHIYDTVLAAQLQAIEASKPGVKMKEVDLAARNYIEKCGYGEYFPHRVGHGLGILVHEYPSIHKQNEELLVDGMAYTIEPGIYVPEIGGVRIEDDILITETGREILTKFTKELLVIK